MKCPACNTQLKEFNVSSVQLDACNLGCGGVWFDNRELKKFDEAHEPSINLGINAKKVQKNAQPYSCPRCEKIKLFPRFTSVKRAVQVDECAGCGGIWLDAGEILSLRSEFPTEEARVRAAEETFSSMFDKDLASSSSQKSQSGKSVSNAFRFISPSWYANKKN